MRTPTTPRRLPGRNAARKAAAAFDEQLMSSPGQSETEGRGSSTFGEPSRSKGNVRVTYRGKGKSRSIPVRSLPPKPKPVPVTRSTSKTSPRKRKMTHSDEGGSDSDPLTSLSLLYQSPTTTGKGVGSDSLQSTPSWVSEGYRHWSTTTTPTRSFVVRGKNMVEEPWEAAKLGTFVWALINHSAGTAEAGDDSYPLTTMWWPARIAGPSSRSVPLCLSLFGEAPGATNTIEIASPSGQNVLSMMNAVGNLRFDESNFIPSYDRLQGSPRKRKKRDASEIESRWRIAVENLMQQHDDDNDGLPQAGEAYSSFHSTLSFNKGSSTSSEKAKKGNGEPSSSNLDGGKHREDATVDGWDPLPCDPTLTIPGELVLSREKKDSSIYWPARIEAYLPPTKPLKPGRYTITFFDSAQAVVPREFFFTSDEDGFGNCKLGQWKSSYEDVLNDKESDKLGEDDTQDRRSSSPPSVMPSSPDDFCNLSIPQQFAYTKSVLVAILNERYPPARERHSDFMKGGALRRKLAENAGARGMMSPIDVEELQRCLLKWTLRDERWAKQMADDEMPNNDTLTVKDAATKNDGANDQAGDSIPTQQKEYSGSLAVGAESKVSMSSLQLEGLPSSGSGEAIEFSSQPLTGAPVQKLVLPFDVDSLGGESLHSHQDGTTAARNNLGALDSYSPPSRQRGCEAYEILSGVERIEYCSDVLLPEAILQILLWRSGARPSIELLPPQEEVVLHEIGVQKSEETDWAYDVVRLREAKMRSLKKSAPSASVSVTIGGTRSRPKRISVIHR